MTLAELGLGLVRLAAPLPVWHAAVDRAAWSATARALADSGARLVSVWGLDRRASGGGHAACAAYGTAEGLLWLELPLDAADLTFPDLAPVFPCAARMQRAVADLSGLNAVGAAHGSTDPSTDPSTDARAESSPDSRPWLDHGLWSPAARPLQHGSQAGPAAAGTLPADYPFVRVEGDGVHEIAVGPVHAGIIEPGHFRFSVVGEKVLRLEQHLGYVHKGIERRYTELPPLEGHRLAGRVSGDSTVAHAWAYCMALESAWRCEIPPRAAWLRALMLERERVANHLGDLGALGNDVALGFGLAQFSRLREDWQRLSAEAFGHRFMMDAVVPGGVAADVARPLLDRQVVQCDKIEREVRTLKRIYDGHAGLQDRFLTTGRVTPELAARLGLTGLAGRASGQPADLRRDHRWAPYDQLKVAVPVLTQGDVAARVAVRFDEVFESLRLVRILCASLPGQAFRAELAPAAGPACGAGWVEGWRGEVLVALALGADGRIVRCHSHDPSWQNWPVLEHAVIGNIVPDFPLINKSFNLSYSGADL